MAPTKDDATQAVRSLPLVGGQLSSAGGWSQVPGRALAIGAEVLQVFSSNPRMWPSTPPDAPALAELSTTLQSNHLPLFLHAIYLINPASPDETLRARSAAALAHALLTGALAGVAGVVTHLGSHRGEGFQKAVPWIVDAVQTAWDSAEQDVAALADGLVNGLASGPTGSGGPDPAVRRAAGPTGPRAVPPLPPLLLETAAGSGDTVGGTLDELQTLVDLLAPLGSSSAGLRVGLCLDTAHMFAAGYAVHEPSGLTDLVAQLDRRALLRRVGLIHLNDSASQFDSKRDRHANPGEGEIGYAALQRVVRHPEFVQVPFALEVPGSEGHGPGLAEIALVKTMRLGAPSPPMPPDSVESGQPTPV